MIFQKVPVNAAPDRRNVGVRRDRSLLGGTGEGKERVIGTAARRCFPEASPRSERRSSREGRESPGTDGEKVGPKRKPHFRLYALPRNSRISLIIRGTWAKVARARASFLSWLLYLPGVLRGRAFKKIVKSLTRRAATPRQSKPGRRLSRRGN